jgi:hypothetical protein
LWKRGHETTTINWRRLRHQRLFLPVDEPGFDPADVTVPRLLAHGAEENGDEAKDCTADEDAEEFIRLHDYVIDSGNQNISPSVILLRTALGI